MTVEIKKHESEIKKYRDRPKGVSEWILIFSREIKKYETFGYVDKYFWPNFVGEKPAQNLNLNFRSLEQ